MTTDSNTNAARENALAVALRLVAMHRGSEDGFVLFEDETLMDEIAGNKPVQFTVGHLRTLLSAMIEQSPASTPEQASVGLGDTAKKIVDETVDEHWWAYGDLIGPSRRDEAKEWFRNDLTQAVLAALSPRPSDVREQQDKSWQCPKCKRWQMHAWNVCRSEFDTGIPCDGVREQPSYTAAGAMTPDQLREWKQQQAEQGDGMSQHEAKHEIDNIAYLLRELKCPDAAKRLVQALAALTQPPRQSEDGRMRSMPAVSTTIPPDEARRNREAAASVVASPAPAAKGEEGGT
jgi:hypothetical protein